MLLLISCLDQLTLIRQNRYCKPYRWFTTDEYNSISPLNSQPFLTSHLATSSLPVRLAILISFPLVLGASRIFFPIMYPEILSYLPTRHTSGNSATKFSAIQSVLRTWSKKQRHDSPGRLHASKTPSLNRDLAGMQQRWHSLLFVHGISRESTSWNKPREQCCTFFREA